MADDRPFITGSSSQRQEKTRRRARAKIYLKDPLVTKETGLLYDFVVVGSDTSIDEGPTSARFITIDYESAMDGVAPPARRRLKGVDLSRMKREPFYEFEARRGTPQEAQINAWATAVDTLDFFQQPQVLGREIPWAFEGSRLRILPHAFYEANAFYNRQTRALHFGYFHGKDRRLVKTALSHDVVSHETSHAILDGLRPFYLNSVVPDTRAFHEFIGDLGAMLSLFRYREMLAHMTTSSRQDASFLDIISDLAPQVGEGLYGDADRSFLRSADNKLTYRDLRGEEEVHKRSQVMSGFAFDLFKAIFEVERERRRKLHGSGRSPEVFRVLMTTARVIGRMLLRPLDLLPPGGIDFKEYAAVVLHLDLEDHPDDKFGYRLAMEAAMRKRGIYPDASTNGPASRSQRRMLELKIVERNIHMIRSSRVGAYRFLDANRDLFHIPRNRDFRVVGVATNRREAELGYRPPSQTIIQYVWDERVPLPKEFNRPDLDSILFPAGGTLAVDDNVNLAYWIRQELGEETRKVLGGRVLKLIGDRAVAFAPTRGLRSGRPFLMQRAGTSQGRLQLNTARMHDGRSGRR